MAESLRQLSFDLFRQNAGIRFLAIEDNVAARNESPHVSEARAFDHPPQLFHLDQSVAADVNTAQQSHVPAESLRFHDDRSSRMSLPLRVTFRPGWICISCWFYDRSSRYKSNSAASSLLQARKKCRSNQPVLPTRKSHTNAFRFGRRNQPRCATPWYSFRKAAGQVQPRRDLRGRRLC